MLFCILFVVNLNTAKTLIKTTGYTIRFLLSAAYYSTVWVGNSDLFHCFPGVQGHGKAVFQVLATRNSVAILCLTQTSDPPFKGLFCQKVCVLCNVIGVVWGSH